MNPLLRPSQDVADALRQGRPVVALETTLVTHGLPSPLGVEVALELEEAVRCCGATPATIGVINGVVRIGMSAGELEQLAATPHVAKLNLSNFAALVAARASSSTTVAATICMAAQFGIRVFATGGIGGVHRQAESTGDVSADLVALSRYPVAVVCAGAKAVLDLPRTREMLETLGVPILGYGTDEFPAFYRRASGLSVDRRCDSLMELAAVVQIHAALGLGTGIVVANPIPVEHELPREVYEHSLATALQEAQRSGITGRDVTPFLLEQMRLATAGQSVAVNRMLLLGNAELAAQLAVGLPSRTH